MSGLRTLTQALILSAITLQISADQPSMFLLEQECKTIAEWKRMTMNYESDLISHLPEYSDVYVNNSLKLQLSRNPLEYSRRDEYVCKVGFIASKPKHRLLLSWTFFGIGEDKNGADWLNIHDFESNLDLSGKMWGAQGQSIGQHRPPSTVDYHSVGKGLSLAYRGHPYFDSFTVILTEYQDVDQDSGACPAANQHLCTGANPMCIQNSLLCDGQQNCGESNSNEESYCALPERHPPQNNDASQPVPIVLICALVAIVIVASCITGAALLYYKWKKRQHEIFESMSRGNALHERPPVQDLYDLSQANRSREENQYSKLPTEKSRSHEDLADLGVRVVTPPVQVGHTNNGHVTGYSHSHRLDMRDPSRNGLDMRDPSRNGHRVHVPLLHPLGEGRRATTPEQSYNPDYHEISPGENHYSELDDYVE